MSRGPRRYEHTQRGPIGVFLFVIGASFITTAFLTAETGARILLGTIGPPLIITAFCVNSLTVALDAGVLRVAFGPLPLFRRAIPVRRIREVRATRSTFIDGWGIHWIPGRGWIWNLWGFACVDLTLEGGAHFRIGSDEADRLAEAIESHRNEDPSPEPPPNA